MLTEVGSAYRARQCLQSSAVLTELGSAFTELGSAYRARHDRAYERLRVSETINAHCSENGVCMAPDLSSYQPMVPSKGPPPAFRATPRVRLNHGAPLQIQSRRSACPDPRSTATTRNTKLALTEHTAIENHCSNKVLTRFGDAARL